MINVEERIHHLQSRRHNLLERRNEKDSKISALDIELTIVRSELLALYDIKNKATIKSLSNRKVNLDGNRKSLP